MKKLLLLSLFFVAFAPAQSQEQTEQQEVAEDQDETETSESPITITINASNATNSRADHKNTISQSTVVTQPSSNKTQIPIRKNPIQKRTYKNH